MSEKIKNLFFLAAILVASFLLAITVWYSPIFFKGFSTQAVDSEGMITAARNYSQFGVLGLENNLNVVVAPSLVKSEANLTSVGNKLTIFCYAAVFKVLGQMPWEKVILIAMVLYALALIFFAATFFYLFGPEESIIFSLIYIFFPVNWQLSHFVGSYEFSLLFFSIFLFLFFYFSSRRTRWPFLILSGIFLGLSGLAREAMFLVFPTVFLWLWRNNKKKELIFIFIPVFLILILFWLPGFSSGNNNYLQLFTVVDLTHSDLHYYGHTYPDPYVYHFDKDGASAAFNISASNTNSGWLYYISRLKVGANMGLREVNFVERFYVGTVNLIRHISRFISIENMGGPFVFLLFILGLYQLKIKNKSLYLLFLGLIITITLLLSYLILAVRDHMMDFGWAVVASVALGLISIKELLKNYYQFYRYRFIYIFIILITLYNLVLANHVYWGREYDNPQYLYTKYLAQKIIDYSPIITDREVIAVGDRELHPGLNYLTGKSIVFIDPNSINKMVSQKKLQEIFDKFNIRYIAGYSQEISGLIIGNSNAKNIANWPRLADI